jgi:hypothetical protein
MPQARAYENQICKGVLFDTVRGAAIRGPLAYGTMRSMKEE